MKGGEQERLKDCFIFQDTGRQANSNPRSLCWFYFGLDDRENRKTLAAFTLSAWKRPHPACFSNSLRDVWWHFLNDLTQSSVFNSAAQQQRRGRKRRKRESYEEMHGAEEA